MQNIKRIKMAIFLQKGGWKRGQTWPKKGQILDQALLTTGGLYPPSVDVSLSDLISLGLSVYVDFVSVAMIWVSFGEICGLEGIWGDKQAVIHWSNVFEHVPKRFILTRNPKMRTSTSYCPPKTRDANSWTVSDGRLRVRLSDSDISGRYTILPTVLWKDKLSRAS